MHCWREEEEEEEKNNFFDIRMSHYYIDSKLSRRFVCY
jgi:hypothetical protein